MELVLFWLQEIHSVTVQEQSGKPEEKTDDVSPKEIIDNETKSDEINKDDMKSAILKIKSMKAKAMNAPHFGFHGFLCRLFCDSE